MQAIKWIAVFYLMLFAPFWETKEPAEWSAGELGQMFLQSPWSQAAVPISNTGGEEDVPVYIGSALPMRNAEAQRWKRSKMEPDAVADEYRAWIVTNASKYIVLTVETPRSVDFSDGAEVEVMKKETTLRVDRKKYDLAMYFPPSSSDNHLRFAFPREVAAKAKKLRFEFYVPSIRGQYREAEFNLKDLTYKGQPEF